MTTKYDQWAIESAKAELFKQLHVAEFWLPQVTGDSNCNLRCQHCYVYTEGRPKAEVLSPDVYCGVLRSLMTTVKPFSGRWDVVFPGMEPLLPKNAEYLWRMVAEAAQLNARSIGMTTNGTLLRGKALDQLLNSGITTINVSLDGDQLHHDAIRGKGTFNLTTKNVRRLCVDKGVRKVITNTTVMATNQQILPVVSRISSDLGCDYAAFHPFEIAVNAKSNLDPQTDGILQGFTELIRAFLEGQAGSIVIEFEASTAGSFFRLFETGLLDDFEVVEDETQFRFLRKCIGGKECLINIIFYPHHFVRTVRVLDDGSLSSCRRIAKEGWKGIGNLTQQSFKQITRMPETVEAAADIWSEYQTSLATVSGETIQRFLDLK